MNHNYYDPNIPYHNAAYLLGMAPMPPPTLQEHAVAIANHLLDGSHTHEEEEESSDEEVNIDPCLCTQAQPQVPAMAQVAPAVNPPTGKFYLQSFVCMSSTHLRLIPAGPPPVITV